MQWSDEPNGGFSTAAKKDLARPLADGDFGAANVNVAEQRRDPDSLLNWMERLIRRRRETPEIGWGTATLIETVPQSLFAQRCDWQGSTVGTVHNLGEDEAEADLDLGDDVEGIDDLLELREHEVRQGRLHVKLGRYGYLWLRLRRG
jgi:glycosidase